MSPRKLLPLLPTLLALALPVAANAQDAACDGADVLPAAGTLDAARSATLCLLNRERTSRGLRPLRADARLRGAADAYSRSMVAQAFFAHVARDGSTLGDRIEASDYLAGADDWALGENLAWGSGPLSTPARTVVAWMRSAGHRHNILTARFREIGIGIVPGAPVKVPAPLTAATYTTEFGYRG